MSMKMPVFSMGVEEEYLLVDLETRDLVDDPPEILMREYVKRLEERVSPEFLRSQVEVGTSVCQSFSELRGELIHLRRTVSEVAREFNIAPIAASTHPFAKWTKQQHTDKKRYHTLAQDLQAVARRLMICGMHVHLGIEDPDTRIDLMNQAVYFLPHILALSTSSPFWGGNKTGLMSYRISIWDELPRTGLPEQFDSFSDFQRHVDILIKAGILEDASKIWWDIRPSARFPTVEMRIADICTRLDDVITIAALYRCLMRMLFRLRRSNQRWRVYSKFLIEENRWRAHRYGIDEGLVDFGKGEIVLYPHLLEELIELMAEDIEFFDCADQMDNARAILKRGTSAHRQIGVFDAAVAQGADEQEALVSVVDMLIEETMEGVV